MFDIAQTFQIDRSVVQNSPRVGVTACELYFKAKPSATNNKSGIQNPGVEVAFVSTINGVPNLADLNTPPANSAPVDRTARVEYNAIQATADASAPTKFIFDAPVQVDTNKEYAILVKFDGHEDFILWTSKSGDILLGSTQVSPGPSGKYVGSYYTYISSTSNTASPANTAYSASNWRPSTDTDLKFKVYAARYAHSGVAINAAAQAANVAVTQFTSVNATGTGNAVYTIPSSLYEYVIYDRKISKHNNVRGGELAFQMTLNFPGGSNVTSNVAVTTGSVNVVSASNTYPNGAAFNWEDIFQQPINDEYIVVHSYGHDDRGRAPYPKFNTRHLTNPHLRTNVRKVVSIESNTVLIVDRPFDFSNSAAVFHKSPVGRVDLREATKSFGKRENLLVLKDSNANASVRFVNNCIEYLSINAAGTGYNNSDILYVTGFEAVGNIVSGGYIAVANLVTNSTGGLTNVYLVNAGAGFVNTSAIVAVVSNSTPNSTSNTSNGSGASFAYSVGCTIGTEFWGWDNDNDTEDDGGYYAGCKVVNLEVGDVIPDVKTSNPAGTIFSMFHKTSYYVTKYGNTHNGRAYYTTKSNTPTIIKNLQKASLPADNTAIMPSRSNEFVIKYANGATNDQTANASGSNASIITIQITSNNDFMCVDIPDTKTYYSKYIVNDDYTNENTNYGNALAKHISNKINFADDRFAEDIVVYMTAYRPANTDIKCFARIHNEKDPEAFDDKDWTMLEMKAGNGVISSSSDQSDYKEYTFGFPQYPNTALALAGQGTTVINQTNVVGIGTAFSSNLAVSDLVKIYTPLFPNNYMLGVVASVTNNTLFTLEAPVSNNGVAGSGMKIDLIGRVGNSTVASVGYPMQGFNNITNDNVVRYYNSSMIEFDTYNTLQVKMVLLANSASRVPKVDSIQVIGVST